MVHTNRTIMLTATAVILLLCPGGAGQAAHGGQGDSLTIGVPVRAGWNLLALPVKLTGPKEALFPAASSAGYVFTNGFRTTDTLRSGVGFWLHFESPETVAVAGPARYLDSIPLRKGWNLVGGLSTNVAVERLITVPPGITASAYYEYAPPGGYRPTDSLRTGRGYWIKSNAAGKLVVRTMGVPCPTAPRVDYGGRVYPTAQIVNQCWFAENLDIGSAIYSDLDQEDNAVIEKYCFINQAYYCYIYGGLYQWNEVMQYSDVPGGRGICPPGWHVPTLGELRVLDTVTAGDGNQLKSRYEGVDSGVGTNATGFAAVLAGYRHLDGTFSIAGYNSYFWTSTKQDTLASSLFLFHNQNYIYFNVNKTGYGFSVRCLKD